VRTTKGGRAAIADLKNGTSAIPELSVSHISLIMFYEAIHLILKFKYINSRNFLNG
jgi:hypothetical protein